MHSNKTNITCRNLFALGLTKICWEAGTDAGTVRQRHKMPGLAQGQFCDTGMPGQMPEASSLLASVLASHCV